MDIRAEKKRIRSQIRELKKAVQPEDKQKWSLAIANTLLNMEETKTAGTILLYHALPDEVFTSFLIEELSNRHKGNKRVILPVVQGEDLVLKEYSPDKIESGYMKIQEPQGEECINPNEIDLAVIPGVAFDGNCNRLGRGKGFYDRLLPYLKCRKIGLGYDFQIIGEIPCENFDKPMDIVITQSRIYKSL